MAIETTVSSYTNVGNGGARIFAFPFPILEESQVLVQLVAADRSGVDGVLVAGGSFVDVDLRPEHFRVFAEYAGADSFSIELGAAPETGVKVKAWRKLGLTQPVTFNSTDLFPAKTLETALDRLTMQMQAIELVTTDGVMGPAGPRGVAGVKGDTGAQGPQGLTGLTGATGPVGAKGDTGAQGPQGLPGATGPTGAKGDSGAQGVEGAAGFKGADGPQGVKGDTGVQGLQGLTGAAGPQGDVGPQGLQGLAGAAGAKGDTGVQGPAGPQGLQGATGLSGAAGAKGDTGAQGLPGSTGQAASVAVGTVTTTAAGSAATIVNSGTSSAAVLDFSLPTDGMFYAVTVRMLFPMTVAVATATTLTFPIGVQLAVDGYTVGLGNTVLLCAQTVTTQNGPWVVTTVGTGLVAAVWTRPAYFQGTVRAGMFFSILFGSLLQGYVCCVYPVTSAMTAVVVGTTGLAVQAVFSRAVNLTSATAVPFSTTAFFRAGQGLAGTAPAKFQLGSLLTTPEAHALEWDGVNLSATSLAAVRRTLAYTDQVAGGVAVAAELTGAVTLGLGNMGTLVRINSAGSAVVTVPTNATSSIGVGLAVQIVQTGVGQVTIAPAAGVTVTSLNSALSLSGVGAKATLTKIATDAWLLEGNIGYFDPYFSFVTSLCHFNGGKGALSFYDTAQAQFWTCYPSSNGVSGVLSGTSPKFGSTSYFANDNYGSAYAYSPNPAAFAVAATDNFALEFFFKTTANVKGQCLFTTYSSSSPSSAMMSVYFDATLGNLLTFRMNNGSGVNTDLAGTVTTNLDGNWHFFQAIRNNGMLQTFVDGVSNCAAVANTVATVAMRATLGYGGISTFPYFQGYIDELRFTKGHPNGARVAGLFSFPFADQ